MRLKSLLSSFDFSTLSWASSRIIRAPLILMTMIGCHIKTIQVKNHQKTGHDLHFTIDVSTRSTKFLNSRKGLVCLDCWASSRFSKRPHFLCIMATDIGGENDKITQGELLCILKMQEKFHKLSFLKKHIIYPVFFHLITKDKYPRIRTSLTCNARFCFFFSWDPVMLECSKPITTARSQSSMRLSAMISPGTCT